MRGDHIAMVSWGLQSGRKRVHPDIANDQSLSTEERLAFAEAGIGASLTIPLVKAGRLVAFIGVNYATPHDFTVPEIELTEEVAERTWAALERARAEAALRDSEERLRRLNEQLEGRVRERTAEVCSLFERLVSVREEERRRVARDIHDQVGQQMTALRLSLEAVRLQAAGRAALVESAERTQRLAEELDRSIDSLTWQLRPAVLEHVGLPEALACLVSGWSQRFGIHAEYDMFGIDGARFAPVVETNVYRLTQEALHNVYKHAQANRVAVLLEQRHGRLTLVVEDDGQGFTVASDKRRESGSFGLINMRERATLAGGQLRIDSTPGRGTTVIVRVPVGTENARPDDETEKLLLAEE